MTQQPYLTSKGQAKLEDELQNLRTVRRREVAEQIKRAAEVGGTVDNAEYEEAKNEQARIEGRIRTLENLLQNAVIISKRAGPSETVQVGSRVKVLTERGQRAMYTIVGSTEADPAQHRISNVSPVGKALLGKRADETVEISTPAGTVKLKIVEIR
ncbi:MAG: transcription elongation factor GreA [Dehalococcoidia bacterium]